MADRTSNLPQAHDAQMFLQRVLDNVGRLARESASAQAFCRGLLEQAVETLSAVGGGVWLLDDGSPALQHDVRLHEVGFGDNPQHVELLNQVLHSGKATRVAPDENAVADANRLFLLVPLKADAQTVGLILVVQRPEAATAAGRGWLWFLVRLAEEAEEFFNVRALRNLRQREEAWKALESFTQHAHRHLDSTGTAYAIANEGRRVIQCDRLSVAVRKGGQLRLAAVSGQASFNTRSEAVKQLESLCRAVAGTGESFFYDGQSDNLPPQVETVLQTYLDQSQAKTLAAVPLLTPELEPVAEDEERRTVKKPRRLIGTLVIESFDRAPTSDVQRARVAAIAEHASQALFNAQQHEGLFLMPLWRAIGKSRVVLEARNLPKTLAAAAAIVLLLLALFLVPADFELEARGALQPVDRQQVFAAVDGTVHEVLVRHGQAVQAGQPLVKLRNVDLQIEQERLIGERSSTLEELQGVLTSLLGGDLRPAERDQLAGRRRQLQQALASLDRQLELLNEQFEELTVRAPLAGQVITWDVRERLMHRPVQRGQVLLTVADPDSEWELEVNMPEDDMGYVNDAQRDSKDPLDVTFILASDPGVEYQGTLQEIHGRAETQGEQGSSVLMQVELNHDAIALLRPGATVVANVHCGRRSLGYVWLHDVWEFVQSRVLFRYF